jgi:hypothetical protein
MSRALVLAACVACAAGVIAIVPTFAHAFWQDGHMIIAQIARNNMDPRNAATADSLFAYMAAIGPFPEAPDMVNGAPWADDIKSFGLEAMSPWHFVNTPYDPTNFSYPNRDCPISRDNGAALVGGLINAVRRSSSKPWIAAIALAFVVHIVGDLHQPLHCADMFSAEFPRGDRGGNDIRVHWTDPAVTELHAFWDSVCGRWTGYTQRPIAGDNKKFIEDNAARINRTYTVTESEASVLEGEAIARETFDLAVSTAYPGITNNCTITTEYQQRCIPVAERQLARGGIRLARILDRLFATWRVPTLPVVGGGAAASDAWNGKATGALIGGIFLGAVVVGAGMYAYFSQVPSRSGYASVVVSGPGSGLHDH